MLFHKLPIAPCDRHSNGRRDVDSQTRDWGVDARERYLNLETFRRNGAAVRTPVWFAADDRPDGGPAALYVYTTADAGKAKRVRNSNVARIAACDMRGTVSGPWVDAVATLVDGEEFDRAMRLLDRKYFPWKQVLNLSARLFRPKPRAVIALRPALPAAAVGA